MKRAMDIAWCILALPLALPLMLACALAVGLTSRGPVFYTQWRLGLKGDPFKMWKLRSMYLSSPQWHNPDGPANAPANDPPFTPVGRFLRATALDELPQIWNILCGEMSVVGPHADLVDQRLLYAERDQMRLRVMPGITGLAQVRGRGAITWEQRRLVDVEYVKRHTIWMDLRILSKTIPCIFLGRGLYTADPPVAPRLENH
jgi:lipopolysaccharide/colanic/teichoic acid biosynthesis glycosyltransferase